MKATSFLAAAISPVLAFCAVEIPAGDDIEVNDGNLADYSSGITFKDATGVVRFNLSQAPAMSVTGAGTIVKTSNADWTMTTSISGFTGDYVLSGSGVVSSGIACAFGSTGDSSYAHSLTVSNGVTLSVTANNKDLLGYRVLVLNGTGHGGRGALEITQSVSANEAIRHVRLGSDATMSIKDGKYIFFAAVGKGIDLNGYRLVVVGRGYIYDYSKLSGEGAIVMRGDSGGYLDFVARDVYFSSDASETSPIVLENHARLDFYNAAKRINRPLWVVGTDNVVFHNEQFPDRNPDYNWATNIIAVGGPVTFTNETGMSSLRVYNSFARRMLTLAGSIKGHGTVSVPDNNVGGVRFEGADSTFDGGLYVNCRNGGQFQAMCPGSVGAYASVTGDYGHIDADYSVSEGDGRWTWADFADFAKKATWLNGAFPLLDARKAEEPQVFDATDIAGVKTLGIAGESVVTNAELLSAGFVWRAGQAKFASASTLDWSGGIGIATASLCTNAVPGRVVLDDGIRVETDDEAVRVGGYEARAAPDAARLIVRRATLVNRNVYESVFTSATNSALVVGGCPSGNGTGVLEIHDGAVVTNKLLVGGWLSSIAPTDGTGRGGVWQFGGSMTALGTSGSHQYGGFLGLDAGSHGGYEMHGGSFTALGAFQIGYYGTGAWTQYGGVAVFTNELGGTTSRYHDIGGGNYGRGVLCLRGGRIDSHGSVAICSTGHPSLQGFGHLVVDGPGAVYDAHDATVTMNQTAAGKGSSFIEINHGGRFRAKTVSTTNGATRDGYFGFNGGTFEKSSGENPKDFFQSANYRPTRVTIYPDGACFDTAGYTGVGIVANLEGTHGNGVLSVPLEAPIVNSGIVAAPLVMIEGDGHGASAVAEFDPATGAVTNILVTAAGWDYETATAKLIVGASTVATIECVVGPVANVGSLTKAGAGDLTLYGTNTYGGATVLAGGVLKLGSDGALPAGTKIELAGGTIDAGAFAETLPTVWEVDAAKAFASGGIVYDGDLSFPAGSTLRVLNLGSVPETCLRLSILKVTGTMTGAPAVVDVDGTSRRLVMTARGLRASVPDGMSIVVF